MCGDGNLCSRNLGCSRVLLKVCYFLRSRAQDIRETARGTLVKIMEELGPKYFSYVLKELRGSLRRGYQVQQRSSNESPPVTACNGVTGSVFVSLNCSVSFQLHVLCFTVNSLLNTLVPLLKPGDLATSIEPLVEVSDWEVLSVPEGGLLTCCTLRFSTHLSAAVGSKL